MDIYNGSDPIHQLHREQQTIHFHLGKVFITDECAIPYWLTSVYIWIERTKKQNKKYKSVPVIQHINNK